jgi:pimeloyl-ACP methyl ester carboxylesterase
MLHKLAARHSEREIWWLHGARGPREHPFAAEAHALLASLPHARVHVFYSAAHARRMPPCPRRPRAPDRAGTCRPGHPVRRQRLRLRAGLVHEYFRASRPPLLAVWGKNDPFFRPAGAEAFKRDIPDADVRFIDGGHFALETHVEEIATAIAEFLRSS